MTSNIKKYNNSVFANRIKCPTVLDWYPSDTKERFESLPKEHQDYWHEQPPISYKINTYGFRSDEFPEKECRESITFLGCSQTFGTGIHKERTWASLVAKHYNLLEINLAIASGSLDSAFRLYNEWQPIHKSKITCLLLPPSNRMEVARDAIWNPNTTQWESIGHWSLTNSRYGMELKPFIMDLLSDMNQEIRTDRNLAAIKYIAQETDSKFIVSSMFPMNGEIEYARDYMHRGPEWNKNMANKFIKAIGEL